MRRGSARLLSWQLATAMFCSLAPALLQGQPAPERSSSGDSAPIPNWQTAARLHTGLTPEPGTLLFDANGIEFRSKRRFSGRWPYAEVKSFDLMARRLVLTDYENWSHHRHGERHFRFDLATPIPPAVAAELAQAVGKPVRNRDPDPRAPSLFTIGARHGTHFGGSNGTLRFREDGIDYSTPTACDNRSWRWADIQTLAYPDPYHLRVGAYGETFEFELKRPLRAEEFDRLWDKLYASDLKGLRTGETAAHDVEEGTN
jgi:hypothetical protein